MFCVCCVHLRFVYSLTEKKHTNDNFLGIACLCFEKCMYKLTKRWGMWSGRIRRKHENFTPFLPHTKRHVHTNYRWNIWYSSLSLALSFSLCTLDYFIIINFLLLMIFCWYVTFRICTFLRNTEISLLVLLFVVIFLIFIKLIIHESCFLAPALAAAAAAVAGGGGGGIFFLQFSFVQLFFRFILLPVFDLKTDERKHTHTHIHEHSSEFKHSHLDIFPKPYTHSHYHKRIRTRTCTHTTWMFVSTFLGVVRCYCCCCNAYTVWFKHGKHTSKSPHSHRERRARDYEHFPWHELIHGWGLCMQTCLWIALNTLNIFLHTWLCVCVLNVERCVW